MTENSKVHKVQVFETKPITVETVSVYRIRYGDGNDCDEIGRVSAKNIEEATEYAIKQYLKPETETDIDGDGEYSMITINVCKGCEFSELSEEEKIKLFREEYDQDYEPFLEFCEECEKSEYMEVFKDEDAKPEYRTIFGMNQYADLTDDNPDTDKPVEYNPKLAEAWRKDSQLGIAALWDQTFKENPELKEAVSPEYREKIRKDMEKMEA